MQTLIILNDPPYGTERSYNGLRLAGSLSKDETQTVRVFLIGDAVACAKHGQKTPNGYYNLERMISVVSRSGGAVAVCGSCLDARGIDQGDLAEGVQRGNLEQLATWTKEAEKVIVF